MRFLKSLALSLCLSVSLSLSLYLPVSLSLPLSLPLSCPLVSKVAVFAIYNPLIESLFDYCDVVWDNLAASQTTGLHKFKNCADRVITQMGLNVRSYVITEELGWRMLKETSDKQKVVLR